MEPYVAPPTWPGGPETGFPEPGGSTSASPDSDGQFQMSDIGKFFNDLLGKTSANEFNATEAEKQRGWEYMVNMLNNKFNADEAQKSREWQSYMRDTAYQSAVMDLKKAGLNPASLSATGSGMNLASTPGSMSASSGSAPGGSAARDGQGSNWLSLFGDVVRAVTMHKIAKVGAASRGAAEAVRSMDREKDRAFRAAEAVKDRSFKAAQNEIYKSTVEDRMNTHAANYVLKRKFLDWKMSR